jgi:hypothetical protein
MDDLLKLLFPAFFLVLWALNQLLNKEGTPQPQPRPGGLGPRPGGALPPAPRPAERPRTAAAGPARPAPARVGPPGRDDDIVILRSESVRPAPGARTNRGRAARAGKPKAAAEVVPRQTDGRSLTTVAPSVAPSAAAAPASQGTLLIGVPARLTGQDIRRALGSLDRVREAILINEVLQPPVSRRGPRRP